MPLLNSLNLWCNTEKKFWELSYRSCNSAAIHACKRIAHRNTPQPPLVLSIKCALISRTSINSWNKMSPCRFRGEDFFPEAFIWKTLKRFHMVIFWWCCVLISFSFSGGVNYVCKVLKLYKAKMSLFKYIVPRFPVNLRTCWQRDYFDTRQINWKRLIRQSEELIFESF